MKVSFLIGSRIYLRPLEREDLHEEYLQWLNDPRVNRYLETGIFPTTREKLTRYYEQIANSPDQVILAIIEKKEGKHIGNVKLGPIYWVHRKAIFGILIGDERFWGQGIATETTHLMVEYAFSRLNLNKIELGVYAEHKAAIRCYEAVGFRIEGCFRESLFHEGKYKDSLWMGLLRSDYCRAKRTGKK